MKEILQALRRTAQSLLRKFVRALFLSVFLTWTLGYLARLWWPFELASHFKPQYLIAALLFVPLFVIQRQWRWLAAALLCVAINCAHVLPWYFGRQPVAVPGVRLRLLLWNVNISNQQYQALPELVRAESPDLIFLQEVTPGWAAALDKLRDQYAHGAIRPSEDHWGLAVRSRQPLLAVDDSGMADLNGPSLELSLQVGARPLHIITSHPPPPMGARNSARRNQKLASIAERLRALPADKVVIGDLNCTMWSSYFRPLTERAGMKNARQGFGLLPSWWEATPLLQIPIDHCLVSPGIRVVDVHTGPRNGSDHSPLIVELELPTSSAHH